MSGRGLRRLSICGRPAGGVGSRGHAHGCSRPPHPGPDTRWRGSGRPAGERRSLLIRHQRLLLQLKFQIRARFHSDAGAARGVERDSKVAPLPRQSTCPLSERCCGDTGQGGQGQAPGRSFFCFPNQKGLAGFLSPLIIEVTSMHSVKFRPRRKEVASPHSLHRQRAVPVHTGASPQKPLPAVARRAG